MGFVLPVLAIGSALVGAVGAIQAGQSQKAWSDYNAQVAQVRAQEAQMQAEALAQQTQAQAQRQAQQSQDQARAQAAIQDQATRRQLGEAAAAYAAAGVDGGGTPLAVMSDLATQGELSRRLLLYKGDVDAQNATYAGQVNAQNLLYNGAVTSSGLNEQATIDRAQGAAAAAAGYTKAGTTLLTGASSFFGNPTVQGWFGSSSSAGQPLTGPLGPGGLLGHA